MRQAPATKQYVELDHLAQIRAVRTVLESQAQDFVQYPTLLAVTQKTRAEVAKGCTSGPLLEGEIDRLRASMRDASVRVLIHFGRTRARSLRGERS